MSINLKDITEWCARHSGKRYEVVDTYTLVNEGHVVGEMGSAVAAQFVAHASETVPAMLDWMRRAKAILEMASIDSNGDCLSSQRQEEAKELLAELEPA